MFYNLGPDFDMLSSLTLTKYVFYCLKLHSGFCPLIICTLQDTQQNKAYIIHVLKAK